MRRLKTSWAFVSTVPRLWTALPASFRSADSVDTFKSQLRLDDNSITIYINRYISGVVEKKKKKKRVDKSPIEKHIFLSFFIIAYHVA